MQMMILNYLKEIEEIEAQEKELEEQRQKKKEELERRREEREKDEKKSAAQRKREMKERKKEAEWLGEPFEDDVEIVPTVKKKRAKRVLLQLYYCADRIGRRCCFCLQDAGR